MKIAAPRVAVSAFVDGKAQSIQSQVLGGLDRFDKAAQASQGDLVVRVDGQRSPRPLQFAAAGAFATAGLALAGGGLALTATGAGLPIAAAAGLLGLYVASMAEDPLRQAVKIPQWKGDRPVQLGQGPLDPGPPGQAPTQRLKQLLLSNLGDFPHSRQVLCLAGHGNHHQVGPLAYQQVAQALQGNPVEQIVLDTCLGGQLEVLSRLAPWSQFITASCQPIPAVGLPFEKMFAPAQLQKNGRQLASSWVDQAKSVTPSLAAWDCDKFQHQLLPALDRLGNQLTQEIAQGHRPAIKSALAHSQSPDHWLSGRVDLGSFLEALTHSKVDPATRVHAETALQAFSESLVQSQNPKTLTFHLSRGSQDPTLPQGWRQFLQAAHFRLKPNWLF